MVRAIPRVAATPRLPHGSSADESGPRDTTRILRGRKWFARAIVGLLRLLRSRPSADWPSGHDREVEPSGPGSLHGYLSAFTGQPRHATFEAVTDAQILVLSTEKLGALPPAAALAVARTTMARSSDEYRHHTAVVANLMQ